MKAYAIKDPSGKILPWYTSFYMKSTKLAVLHNLGSIYDNWKQMYKDGYRCVPVLITEIKNEKV